MAMRGAGMHRLSLWVKLLALVVAFGFLSAGVAVADELYARIRGTVTDATGASVPDATVTVTNTGTGISKSMTTGPDGLFELVNLPIGSYKLTAVKTSFKTFTETGITLAVNQIYVVNVRLEVGTVTEQILIEAAPTQVETTSMQLGIVITGQKIVDLPLNGRNWIQLQQTQPGVVASSDRFTSNFATNGSQTQQNSYLINGTDSNDLPLNSPVVIPSPDAIAEFQLVTNTINPEYGRNSGGILNAVIKSGTNSLHGSAFDFYRDTSLNARNFFLPKPQVFHQNQFGGTIGGPVWKDHTFWFFSYQGTRARQAQAGQIGSTPVFTAAQRAGSFGATAFTPAKSKNKSPIPLFGDSASPCPVSGGTPCAAGTAYSSLFSTGNIPTQDLNSVALSLMNQFVPLPNFAGNLFTFNPVTVNSADQYLYRVDHTFNAHDTIWFYNFIQTNPSTDALPFTGSTLPGIPQFAARHTKQYTAAWMHTFSPTTTNEFRAGYTRFNFDAVEPVNPTLPSSAGFTGINPQVPSKAGLPVIAVTGLFTLGFSDNGPQPRIDQTYQLTDNLSKVYGKHSLKFGFEGRRFNVSNPFFARLGGHYDFAGRGAFSTGNAGADYLLGFPDSYFQTSGNFIDGQAYEYYFYAQDQWKIRSNLTLIYGMGYQIDTPITDRFNNARAINCFRPFQQSAVFPTAPRGLTFPGDTGCSSSGYATHYNDFGPRVGFAYSPNWGRISGGPGKFSIRGGYGIYFNRGEEELTLQNLNAPPFSLASNGIADVAGNPSFIAPFTDIKCVDQNGKAIAGCVPSGPSVSIPNKFPFTVPAAGSAVDFGFFESFSLNVLDPNLRVPYAMNYNLTIQRELPGRMIASVGYVGSVARRLQSTHELNPGINPAGCAANPTCVANRGNQPVRFPGNFNFPGNIFGGIGQQSTDGSSHYNSLQISVNKAPSHGLTFLASYTYSHSLDFGSSFENSSFGGANRGQNPFNPRLNYGDSQFDARHRLVFSSTYELPSIRKIHGFGGIPSRFTDGWRFAGIATLQSGFPVDIRNTGLRSLTCDNFVFYACWDVPNVTGPVQLLDPRTGTSTHPVSGATQANSFFTAQSFALEAFGTFGNVGRNPFHGPGINNFDMMVAKDTRITESTKIELRLEMFNVWNHAQFNNPSGNINSGLFGRVTTAKDPRILQLAGKFYF
jgi:Carboxypeptidase regulatory-like domain